MDHPQNDEVPTEVRSLELVSVIGFGGIVFEINAEPGCIDNFCCREHSWWVSFTSRWIPYHIPSRLHCNCGRRSETHPELPLWSL